MSNTSRFFMWLACAMLVASMIQWGCKPGDGDGDSDADGDSDGDGDGDGDSDGDGDGDGDADCGLEFSTDAVCQGCMETSCCDELGACGAGTDCGALETCLEGCADGDETCQNQCVSDNEAGRTDAQALITCATDSCGEDCGLVGICDTELGYEDEALNDCINASCCGSFTPCYEDATCAACLQDPSTAGCDTNALYQAFMTCTGDSCGTSICGSELATGSLALNQCINDNCCASFTPCEADATCNACLLDPSGAGCDANALFTAYTTCEDASCPTSVCGTGIGNWTEAGDPVFECNECDTTNCCTSMETCVGDGSDAALELCVACLGDPAGATCTDDAIGTAAGEFNTCQETNCATECGAE